MKPELIKVVNEAIAKGYTHVWFTEVEGFEQGVNNESQLAKSYEEAEAEALRRYNQNNPDNQRETLPSHIWIETLEPF